MLQRRIELCGDAPRAPMQPCKRRVRPPTSSPPAQGRSLPEQAQSEKSQGVRGTESPESFDNTVKKTENYVSVFSGELQIAWSEASKRYGFKCSPGERKRSATNAFKYRPKNSTK